MPAVATTASRALPVRLSGVGRRFGGEAGRQVLHDVDLDIEAGEVIAILGPSGCGKSTLLRQIAGLDAPDTGHVLIDGTDARSADQRCAVAFQEPRLLPWRTLRSNISLGLPRSGDTRRSKDTRRSRDSRDKTAGQTRVTELLDLVGLTASAHLRPREVSGGMAQRTSLARALARSPKVLLLDEPFGALDALTRLRMHDLLLDIHTTEPTTVVLVTHDVDEALYLADRIVLLADLSKPTAGGTGHHPDTPASAPARSISRVITVPGTRPRDRSDPALASLRESLLATLGVERHHAAARSATAADGTTTTTPSTDQEFSA